MPREQIRFRPGDIIGFSGKDWVSDTINVLSLGVPRFGIHHVGIVGYDEMLFESRGMIAEHPCNEAKCEINGVQVHSIEEVFEYTPRAAIWHYRLRSPLYRHESDRLEWFLRHNLGIPYDLSGAIKSGGIITHFITTMFRPENTSALFCSELACDALVYTGRFQTNNISGWSPNRLCRNLVRNGVVDRPVLVQERF